MGRLITRSRDLGWLSLLLIGFLGRSLLRDSLGRGLLGRGFRPAGCFGRRLLCGGFPGAGRGGCCLLRRGLRAAGGFGGRRLSRGLSGAGRGGCCLLRRGLLGDGPFDGSPLCGGSGGGRGLRCATLLRCLPANGFRRAPAYRARLARDVAERLFHVVDETLSSHHTPWAGSVFTYSMRLNIFGRGPTGRKDGVAAVFPNR